MTWKVREKHIEKRKGIEAFFKSTSSLYMNRFRVVVLLLEDMTNIGTKTIKLYFDDYAQLWRWFSYIKRLKDRKKPVCYVLIEEQNTTLRGEPKE